MIYGFPIEKFQKGNFFWDTLYNQGEWTWLDGQPWDFARWGENEPNGGNTENCLELVKWAEWVRSVFPFDCIRRYLLHWRNRYQL